MMYHGDSGPQDQASDAAMTALYQQLNEHDLPGDPQFDTEAGFRDLMSRTRERAPRPAPARRERELVSAASTAAPAGRELLIPEDEAQLKLELARLGHDRRSELTASRTTTIFFAGIAAMAVITMTLIAALHMTSLAAITALTVIDAVAAAAGTIVHRVGALARRTAHAARDHPAPSAHASADAFNNSPASGPETGTRIHVAHMSGPLTVNGAPPSSSQQPARLHHRAVNAVLAALTLVTAAASAIGIAIMIAQDNLTGYEITLLAPTATSVLLLLTTWWWRTTDRAPTSADDGTAPGTAGKEASPPARRASKRPKARRHPARQ